MLGMRQVTRALASGSSTCYYGSKAQKSRGANAACPIGSTLTHKPTPGSKKAKRNLDRFMNHLRVIVATEQAKARTLPSDDTVRVQRRSRSLSDSLATILVAEDAD
jgi:hypothetical protein